MVDKFKNHISKSKIISFDDKILATVSGGVDSVVLCYLFKSMNLNFEIAHCNFKLREKDADEDENFVRSLAEKLEVKFHFTSFDTKKYASQNGISTQMAARDLRYAWFDELKNQYNFNCITTAHHKNDNVETVLLNLVRGTSHKGLAGIKQKDRDIIRPLLPFTKEQILDYANQNSIEWREDVSNKENKYKRNLVRNEVIPLLEKLNPNFINTFSENIEKFKLESEVLDSKHLKNKREFLINEILNSEVPMYEIWNWIEQFGFNFSDAKDIYEGLERQSGKEYISNTHRILKDRDKLIVSDIDKKDVDDVLVYDLKQYGIGNSILEFSKVYMVNYGLGENVAFLNYDKLRFPLKIRKWKEGDKFKPLGMKGNKLISDFLIDEKVNLNDKKNQLVVECNNEIVWIVGRRISEDYKVFDEGNVIKIELK